MFKTLKVLLILFLVLLSFNRGYAQLEAYKIDGEGWAKGNLVEIGINSKGVYGAQTLNKPPSFHDNREIDNNLFGFIANPLNDGWVDYDGDFFTPGDPEEGFCIEINGVNYNNNNGIFFSEIPGKVTGVNIISSDCFEDIAQISWEGNVEGLNIKRYYSITQDGLFIQMTTFIKNLSDVTKENIYFMHNVDPDNNVTLSGFYETDMELISQASSLTDQTCLVTASQRPLSIPEDMDGSDVSFYANSEKARATFGGFNNRSASQIWNGDFEFINTEGATRSFVDEAISIAFNFGDIPANESVRFTYYYILEKVDETFVPFIVNAIQENPSVCNGKDGKLIFSGLTEGVTYTISYVDDGVFIPEQDFVADDDGIIEITNLDAGLYSNISLSFSGCSTTIATDFELMDPEHPNYTISKRDYSNCITPEGGLTFSGLTPLTNYSVQFTHNGDLDGPYDMSANINGDIIFNNLVAGIYTDFVFEQYECITESSEVIEIIGPSNPDFNQIQEQFYCDEDFDYVTTINLALLDYLVLGTDSSSRYEITYHQTEEDAKNSINLAASNYTTTGESSYMLYVKKTHRDSGCNSYSPFTITINLPPDFNLEDGILCVNNDDSVNYEYDLPILNTGLSDSTHDFEWFFEGNVISGETSSTLIVNSSGNYSAKATIKETGCHYTMQAIVSPSGPPQFLDLTITSLPFSDNHTVEIEASGYGDYIFSVDNGATQQSNVLMNLNPGYHTFQIIDTKGCGIVNVEKTIIGYIRYFTPNDDGFNDYWQIIGIEELIDPQIFIFDRYGKILKQLNPNNKGWDGTFNGKPLPQSDYWFRVIFKDDNDIEREFLEHFTLKR
ncbi:T9SS type B sorting domain-containing protein [Flaviramulus sp. BrNp1-15]|uniref:T9SS type B sorting domain-containing protein n=1 Tax=Flaviramulus sp. BrNp1-15 TaxID=2916754 RepID=UPI001EE8A5EF|nr:T9SS type B sorting domain-containing protein [Flaviramulus sp. BrNp1-15]ULC59812.1 T9SS type B sorting domain-containing protein [Flaviramulus sp. BrNp1-15]